MLLAPLVAGLASGLTSPEPGVRLRCAVGLERVTRAHPELLAPHKRALLGPVAASPYPEVQWHLAQLVPRLALDRSERVKALAQMVRVFDESTSGLTQVNALEAIVELAQGHPEHEQVAGRCLQNALLSTSARVRLRAQRLLGRLDETSWNGQDRGDVVRSPCLF